MEKNFLVKVKNFLTLGAANFISLSVMAVFWMYLASLLEKSEYGYLGYLISIANVAYSTSSLGLGRAIIVYAAKNENVVLPAYTLGLISSSIAGIIVFVITQNVSISFLVWSLMIFFLKTSEITSKKQYLTFAKYKIVRSLLVVIIGLVLFQFLGIDGIVLGFAFSALIAIGGLYNYAKQKKQSITIFKPKIKFMLNSWGITLSDILLKWGDKIIIGSIFGFSTLGTYLLAAQYTMLLLAFSQAVMTYLLPQESQRRKNQKIKFFVIAVGCIISVTSYFLAPHLINSFFPTYQESIFPAQILSFVLIPNMINVIYSSQFIGKEKPKIVLVRSCFQVILYFSLITILSVEYGLVGIAMAMLISEIMMVIYSVIMSKKYL